MMLSQLHVEAGHTILEIGAGTGYNAGLLAHLTGPTGQVITLDVDDDLVTTARAHLTAAGITNAEVIVRDGAWGTPPRRPMTA